MTQYLEPSFSVALGSSQAFRDNYDRIFGKKTEGAATEAPAPAKLTGFSVVEDIAIGLVNCAKCKECSNLYHFNGCDPGCPVCSKGPEP